MTAAYGSIGTLTTSLTGSLNPGAPSGLAATDLMLMQANVISASTSASSIPDALANWTLMGSVLYFDGGAGLRNRIQFYWRIADGTSPDNPTLTIASTPGSWMGVIVRVTGADPTTPIADSVISSDGTAPVTIPSVTSANANSLAVVMGATYLTETGTWTFSNSFTNRLGTTSGPATFVATKAVNAGAVGSVDVTNSTTLIRVGFLGAAINPVVATGRIFSMVGLGGGLVGPARGLVA